MSDRASERSDKLLSGRSLHVRLQGNDTTVGMWPVVRTRGTALDDRRARVALELEILEDLRRDIDSEIAALRRIQARLVS